MKTERQIEKAKTELQLETTAGDYSWRRTLWAERVVVSCGYSATRTLVPVQPRKVCEKKSIASVPQQMELSLGEAKVSLRLGAGYGLHNRKPKRVAFPERLAPCGVQLTKLPPTLQMRVDH